MNIIKDINLLKDIDYMITLEGFTLLIDKQVGWTSFDVVKKLKRVLQIKKVGHAGTLDPFATGLLIVCFNKATKSIQYFQDDYKVYEAVLELGKETDTYDTEGKVVSTSDEIPNESDIINAVNSFIGEQEQVPPMYSALKVKGKRLYELARKGIEVERKSRKITIHSIEDININDRIVKFTVKCTKGTYIRSLAYDIGKKLGCGAYLKELRRTFIGEHSVSDAFSISEIEEIFES